jgi:hypothetical protein
MVTEQCNLAGCTTRQPGNNQRRRPKTRTCGSVPGNRRVDGRDGVGPPRQADQRQGWTRAGPGLPVCGKLGLGVAGGFLIRLLVFGEPWHLPPASDAIPTWIMAIATAVLAAFATVTAYDARQEAVSQL